MEVTLELIKYILPVVSAIGGIWVGGTLNLKTQKTIFKMQHTIEIDKIKKENLFSVHEIYNRVLERNGSKMMGVPIGGFRLEFNIEFYTREIRPILYEKYHLLHRDVADGVLEIDKFIEKCKLEEEIDSKSQEYLVSSYYKLIDNILIHQHSLRIGLNSTLEQLK
ncbi:hypothetical protein [Lederbergia galactosidilytica]|uniref:hypothetical protein n=1 Tax=Lederbergia galactosidilytica TaxID=217031 RepID=UPI0007DB0322|nr:hypothetical protein [Lederbergia galactosidilytica]